jgi:dTDP-4-amino-4,6-dideoxygalactose transaminase
MTMAARQPGSAPVVPLLDLKPQYRLLREAIESALRKVCDSQQFILGPEVARLEERIAAYCGTGFAVGVSSGTDALLVSLMALDIGADDEVVTSTYSFFATGGVIARLGARPVFCDIDPETGNLDPCAVETFLRQRCRREGQQVIDTDTGRAVKALIPVHLYGQMADMDALSVLAQEYGLYVIEDAAQAIGAETADGRRAGSIGDVGCLSFYPGKNLGAFGDAGMCVTQSAELAGRIASLRVHGAPSGYRHSLVGGNFRLDTIQAAVLNVKLDHLDAWTEARREHAFRYSRRLAEGDMPIRPPTVRDGFRHVFNQYVVEVEDRDALQAHLRFAGIGTAIYYRIPMHMQECFAYLGYRPGDCPVAERLAQRSLALPVYPEMTIEQQDHVLDMLAGFYHSRRS